MENCIVIDLGTTYFKATLFDSDGKLCALLRRPTPVDESQPGYGEIHAQVFRNTITAMIRDLYHEAPQRFPYIEAITFATQTNSFILLDENDTPLTPIILWNDTRAKNMVYPHAFLGGPPGHYQRTGIPAISPEFMVAKLYWFREMHPEVIAKTAKLCLISDYLTLWLTGKHVTEIGAAGLTGLLDIQDQNWCPRALEHFQVNPGWMPTPMPAGSNLGALHPDLQSALNLPDACQFILGALDQYAGAIGVGNIRPGSVSETTGTVLATVRCTDQFDPQPDSGIFWGPIPDDLYYQMVFGDLSAGLLDFYRTQLTDPPTFAQLDEAAACIAPESLECTLPLTESTASIHATLCDWARDLPQGQATRAIFEGVAHALHEQLCLLCKGTLPGHITCAGGAAKSDLWLQIKADVLSMATRRSDCSEATSLGAAMIAMATLTQTPLADVVARCVNLAVEFAPDPKTHEYYKTSRT